MRKIRASKLTTLKKKCWKLCSEYNRRKRCNIIDGKVRCYTCNAEMHWRDSQAGHMIGGRNGSILFCDEIIRPQCVRCNIFLKGNYGIFARNFIADYGIQEYDKYVALSTKTKQLKRADVEELIQTYKMNLDIMNRIGLGK